MIPLKFKDKKYFIGQKPKKGNYGKKLRQLIDVLNLKKYILMVILKKEVVQNILDW